MSDKEFNLKQAREKIEKKLVELIPKLGCGIVNRIIQQIKDQDKAFVNRIKELMALEGTANERLGWIDKIAGEEDDRPRI